MSNLTSASTENRQKGRKRLRDEDSWASNVAKKARNEVSIIIKTQSI